jgi:hypothetical protein
MRGVEDPRTRSGARADASVYARNFDSTVSGIHNPPLTTETRARGSSSRCFCVTNPFTPSCRKAKLPASEIRLARRISRVFGRRE